MLMDIAWYFDSSVAISKTYIDIVGIIHPFAILAGPTYLLDQATAQAMAHENDRDKACGRILN